MLLLSVNSQHILVVIGTSKKKPEAARGVDLIHEVNYGEGSKEFVCLNRRDITF